MVKNTTLIAKSRRQNVNRGISDKSTYVNITTLFKEVEEQARNFAIAPSMKQLGKYELLSLADNSILIIFPMQHEMYVAREKCE